MEIKVGLKVACPPHGVGVVEAVEEREIEGKKLRFFRIKLVGKNMSILVPAAAADESGIRPILAKEQVQEILGFLSKAPKKITKKWTLRHRINADRLRTGDVRELATVVRNLSFRMKDKELSYSEKRMFEEAFEKLSEEIALALGEDIGSVKKKIWKILKGARE